MIARLWRGATRPEEADAYLDYLKKTGVKEYRATAGNLGVLGLRRIISGRAEFLLISLWESEEAIRAFAGQDTGRAVFYPEDDAFLIEKDEGVDHFEVAFQDWR